MKQIKHLVIIEDDFMLADLTQNFLQQNNYKVSVFNSANSFFAKADHIQIDLIICDINLPEMDGFELCKRSRQYFKGPFIFLTARKNDEDHILGLNVGADDFINKPVKPDILLARINSALRTEQRHQQKSPLKRIELSGLIIDKNAQLLVVAGHNVTLTSDDMELLWFLIANKDKTLTRDDLFNEVIGRKYDGQDRVIDGRVSRLRKKFNDIKNNPYEIKTIWRLGYVFSDKAITST